MPIYRVAKNQDYTVMCNHHLRDKRLSWKAKGLISYILSLPDNWDFSAKGLALAGRDGESLVRSALRELEDNGYLRRAPLRGDDGRITDWVYTVYESPRSEDDTGEGTPETAAPEEASPVTDEPVVEYPHVKNPLVDEPLVDNGPQQNTKIINTKIINTKSKSIINNNNNIDSIHTSVKGEPEDGVTEILRDAERAVAEANASLKKNAESRRAMDARFERFWEVWPRKVARKAARSAFERLAPDDGMTDRMIAAVRLQMERDSRFRETRYTPHPATWINGAEWENGYDEPKKESSFDTDEFFDLALKRSQEKMEAAR